MTDTNYKEMLAGLFLSKFDRDGLAALGFKTWNEAYNTLALAVKGRPLSVKGYRDEFDALLPESPRQGWHKREPHQNRVDMLRQYGDLPLDEFAELVRTQFAVESDAVDPEIGKAVIEAGVRQDDDTPFARRMVTGLAAENYFAANYQKEARFAPCAVERTTMFGCGFDFKLMPPKEEFLGVEVKGLVKARGTIQLTEKEFHMAEYLKKRFYLYVVTDFAAQSPKPVVIENPLESGITFEERAIESTQRIWTASIAA